MLQTVEYIIISKPKDFVHSQDVVTYKLYACERELIN